jgi:predicted DCC family thiol-disulfide oxidoreductase YuxK
MGPVWLSIFAALMFALYLLFLDAEPRSRLVIWDEQRSFCTVWIRWFARLDWLRVHRLVGSSVPSVLARAGVDRAEADAVIHLVAADGRRAAGFGAIRSILESLPVSFLWAPLLRFPPAERLGDRAYAAVAARRSGRALVARSRP